MELHPDRNFGDVDSATIKFAEVQSAHEVLSDPQERAWYDSHREDILQGNDGISKGNQYENNARLTTTRDIVALIGRFGPSVRFTDASDGFYGILKSTFETLAEEEYEACRYDNLDPVNYPGFGTSIDQYEEVVRPFYRAWVGFSTKKSFSWRDQYRTSDAPDRATRRMIEKENKKLRDEGIREFNDAVRALVTFVRRRDPRYLPNTQTDDDRQKILRDTATAQAARSRATNQAKLDQHVVPEWAQSSKAPEEATFSDSEESEVEHIECVACRKIFKSEKQYETHERSKKHIKTVQLLKREMLRENKRLGLDDTSDSTPEEEFEKLDLEAEEGSGTEDKIEVHVEQQNTASRDLKSQLQNSAERHELGSASESSAIDDEYAPRKDVESRIADAILEPATPKDSGPDEAYSPDIGKPKVGKAKLKKAKKAARQDLETRDSQEVGSPAYNFKCIKLTTQFICAACNNNFPSKNKLFDHIKEFPNHAQPVPKAKGKKRNART